MMFFGMLWGASMLVLVYLGSKFADMGIEAQELKRLEAEQMQREIAAIVRRRNQLAIELANDNSDDSNE